MEDDLNSSKNLLNKNQFIEGKDFDNKIFEQLNESEPLFELIKQPFVKFKSFGFVLKY